MWKPLSALLALVLVLAAVGTTPVAATAPCGNGGHPACPTPLPSYENPDVAVTQMMGFETQAGVSENWFTSGTVSFSTAQARTGAASFRVNPASGASGSGGVNSANTMRDAWVHFGLYVATLPSVTRVIAGDVPSANLNNLALNSDGTLSVRINTTVVGTSSVALVTGRWYWIGWANRASLTGVLLQIDAVDQVTGTSGSSTLGTVIGAPSTEASALDLYFDDYITDGAGFINPSRVGLAVPISDSSRVDWTNDAAGTSNLFDAIDNKPPVGIADTTSGSGLHQIRDATNGTDTYVANMTTYATLGIVSTDKVLAVQAFAVTGAPSATSPKTASLTVSNPTINIASVGNFYAGSIAGTFSSGWIQRAGAVTASPTVTIANSPVITVTQDSSTRIAMVCFLGLQVAWTPGALGHITNVGQAVARAANY